MLLMWLLFLFQKLVFADDLKILVKSSGCESPRHCVFTMTPVDFSTAEYLGPTNVFFPSDLSDAIGLQDPQLKVEILLKLILPLILYKSLLVTWRQSHSNREIYFSRFPKLLSYPRQNLACPFKPSLPLVLYGWWPKTSAVDSRRMGSC